MGPQPGRKRQASRHHCANSSSRTGRAHPQPPPGQAGGLSSCSPWMCEAKGLERGLEQKGEGKGGAVSLSLPRPPLLQRQPLPLAQRKGIYLQNKSPLDMKRGGLWPGKAKRSPQPVLDQCILIAALLRRTTKRDRAPHGGWAGEGGRGGADSGGGGLGKQTPNPESRPQQPLWVGPHCLGVRSHAPPAPHSDGLHEPPRALVLVGWRGVIGTHRWFRTETCPFRCEPHLSHHLWPLPATPSSIPPVGGCAGT